MTKRRARQRKPLNIRPVMDPRDPATWGPAPADRPKPHGCPIKAFAERGSITPAEEQAALEIETVFRYIAGGLMSKAARMGREDRGQPSEPSAWLVQATERYKRWADRLSQQRDMHDDPTLAVVVAAVVDGQSMRSLDAEYRWRRGNAATCFVSGLRLYANLAGWQKERAYPEPGSVQPDQTAA